MKAKGLITACVVFLGTVPELRSQTNDLAVGHSAPPLEFNTLLQAPNDTHADWPALKDKVVVLEFWATWCVPCVRELPHLNEIADALKDAPVQFIAISDEEPEAVARFLKKHPIRAWIGLKGSKSMFARYGVKAIPHTVVVDRNGKIADITRPSELTEARLRDLLAGRPLALPPKERLKSFSFRPGELPDSSYQDRDALFHVLIRPSESVESGWGGSGGKFTFIGSSVLNMLSAAYGIDETQIVANTHLPDGRFDAVIRVPANEQNTGRSWLSRAVNETFGLRARRETRELDALVLTVKNRKAEHLTLTNSTGGSSSHSDAAAGEMQSMNMPISSVVGSLQGLLKKPVIDETGLTNRYDWALQWDAKGSRGHSHDALLSAVREQLGLDLTPAKRPVEILVVDKGD